jgi:hypothetical protein
MKHYSIMTIALLGALCAVSAVQAQSSTTKRPNPPPQVCINANCVTASRTSSGHIKWNPGHYAVSASWFNSASDWTTKIKPEIDLTMGDKVANVLGWMMLIHWPAIENTTAGIYDWTLIDQARGYIATTYPGKRFGLQIQCEEFGGAAGNPVSAVPNYILTNSAYGAGYQYDANHYYYGYWPMSYGSTCAWWIPAVANRVKALFAALAAHASPFGGGAYTYDTDPYVEVVTSIGETSISLWNPPDNTGYTTANGTYSAAAAKTQWEGIIASMVASFPHTNVVDMNNFFAYTASDQTLTSQVGLDDMNARAAASGPDVFMWGRFTWGQLGYIGGAAGGTPGFTSMWQKAPYIGIVEQPDYGKYGETNQQICDAAWRNPTQSPPGLGASHLFWTPVQAAGSGGEWAKDIRPIIIANPIPAANKVYPSSYP